MEDERAGILQSPCDVWNDDVGSGAKSVSFHLHGQGQAHGMVASMQLENAVELDRRVSPQFDFAGQSGRRESDLGKALAFENLLVHFVVAALVAAVTAGSVDDDEAAGRASRLVEVNRPAFDREGSMHGMESSRQGELDVRVSRVKIERHLLGVEAFVVRDRKQEESGAQVASDHGCRFMIFHAELYSSAAKLTRRQHPLWLRPLQGIN